MTAALAIVCLALAGTLIYVLRQNARERADLLQRIQAPELAVVEHAERDRTPRPAKVIPLGDDEGMIQARRRRLAARGEEPDLEPEADE